MTSPNDALGRSVTFPLPEFQTDAGGRDPLPPGSPIAIGRQGNEQHSFELYLNRHNDITHERRVETNKPVFDTLEQLRAGRVY
jgi:hypothetical protein